MHRSPNLTLVNLSGNITIETRLHDDVNTRDQMGTDRTHSTRFNYSTDLYICIQLPKLTQMDIRKV